MKRTKREHDAAANDLLVAFSALTQAKEQLDSALRHCKRAKKDKLRIEIEITAQRLAHTSHLVHRSFEYHNKAST